MLADACFFYFILLYWEIFLPQCVWLKFALNLIPYFIMDGMLNNRLFVEHLSSSPLNFGLYQDASKPCY